MGAETDYLDSKWVENVEVDAIFAVRAILEEVSNSISEAIVRGGENYPTGDVVFDAFVAPVVTDLITIRNKFASDYAELLGWRQP